MKPIVTVGVCVKNCEDTIKEVINTILDQDFPHEYIEVIFVDDGSEDKTLSVLKDAVSKMDMEVKIFHNEWKGLGMARNVVVYNANGDYIVWVDGDMTLPTDHIRKQVEFMEKNPKAGIAKGKYGLLERTKIVAALENIAYVVADSKYDNNVSSKLPGTGGSIYRVKAIKQVGGFNGQITGAGEDLDAAYRIAAAGWQLHLTPTLFHEKRRETLKALWKEYFWHGYGMHYITHNFPDVISLVKMTPFAGLLTGVLYSHVAYKITHRKIVFLLPLHFVFKMTAWLLGFTKSHLNSYGHENQKSDGGSKGAS